MKWPVAIPIESIATPFPHELWAYGNTVSFTCLLARDPELTVLLQSISTESDQTVEDILNGRRNGSLIGGHLR